MVTTLLVSSCFLYADDEKSETKIYPLEFDVQVYPATINFGDICFLTYRVTNRGEHTLFLPRCSALDFEKVQRIGLCNSWLQVDDKVRLGLNPGIVKLLRPPYLSPPKIIHDGFAVAPNENMDFYLTTYWIPTLVIPANSQIGQLQDRVIKLKNNIDKNNNFFNIHSDVYYHNVSIHTYKKDIADRGLTMKELLQKGFKFKKINDVVYQPYHCETKINIKNREDAVLKLIKDWYFELTTVSDPWCGVFCSYELVRKSPLCDVTFGDGITVKIPNKVYDSYKEFIKSLRTRTPELLQRIKRTKELETELLKLPDSELSQNMKEFIQLRGYLVDLRFAENEKDEEIVFNNFVTFIDKSKDKELWIKFVDEIALKSIFDNEYFPHEKVESYRKRLNEKFAKPETIEGQK
jgi:ribosomal protein S8